MIKFKNGNWLYTVAYLIRQQITPTHLFLATNLQRKMLQDEVSKYKLQSLIIIQLFSTHHKLFHFIQALIKVRYLYFIIKTYYFLRFSKTSPVSYMVTFFNHDAPNGQPHNERGGGGQFLL